MNPLWWSSKSVLVTGAHGFLGRHVVKKLTNSKTLCTPTHRELDWMDSKAVRTFFARYPTDVVIHLAANCGGIGYNQTYPGDLIHDNLLMALNVVDQCKRRDVKKLVCMGTVCGYPKDAIPPFREADFWNGYPEPTNAAYGTAKRATLELLKAYRAQYRLNGIYLIPINLYGPGDHFEPEKSHVIPALIKKFVEAKDEVTIWGTGSATRSFLYVEDCADAILKAAELYDKPEPVNIGSPWEISIASLASLIARLTDFKGTITYDVSKPDGQPRRSLNAELALREFGWKAETNFEDGLRKTIQWYRETVK